MDGVASGRILLLIFTLLSVIGKVKLTCPHGDFENSEGICCNKCAPGFKLEAECKYSGHKSTCVVCATGQFSEHLNYSPTCIACKVCKASKKEVELIKCSTSKDTVCRCKEGYYKSRIESITYECLPCKSCGINEEQKRECTHEGNTVCECKSGFYRVKNKCEPCDSCRAECPHRCLEASSKETPETRSRINEICLVVVAAVLVAVSILVTYFTTKRCSRKKPPSIESPSNPLDSGVKVPSQEVTENSLPTIKLQVFSQSEEVGPLTTVEAMPLRSEPPPPVSNLPDCVPLEVKTHEVIYMVLDRVPVPKVKRLVRLLGVREIDIEQAEVDWRYCQDAHYQMLKIWSQTANVDGSKSQILSNQLLQDLIQTLRKIDLVVVAEALEEKYNVQ